MKIFKNKQELKKEILNLKNISFVPTMGSLHDGHVYLIKKAKKLKFKVLVSIFVNPKQFEKKKDFTKYPKNIKKDLLLLKSLKVDIVFIPSIRDIFSFKTNNKIYLHKFSKKLCGKYRKGHFKGVINVVNRFLEIIKPKNLVLGLKDYQQLILIKKHIDKCKIKTKIVKCKIIREKNGIACSSRNNMLKSKQIIIASKVVKYLKNKKIDIKRNLNLFNKNDFKKDLFKLNITKLDYVEIYNMNTLKVPKTNKEDFKLFIAYFINKVRMIDNI